MSAQDGAVATKMIDTTSNRSKAQSHSHTHIEKTANDEEDSYLSGSEHDVYGREVNEEDEEEQEVRDFDLTGQLSAIPPVPNHLHPLILTEE